MAETVLVVFKLQRIYDAIHRDVEAKRRFLFAGPLLQRIKILANANDGLTQITGGQVLGFK